MVLGGHTLTQLMQTKRKDPFSRAQTTRDETAAIVFTTAPPARPKGWSYTHGNFEAQIRQIQAHFKIEPDEVDLPTFPPFRIV